MARNIRKRTAGRAQHLAFTLSGVKVQAARYKLTGTRFSPWLITQGEDALPGNAVSRGQYLSKLFAA